jgi:hypothetical protein
MELYDIKNLKRDTKQTAGITSSLGLYNLFDATFKYVTNVLLYQYTVPLYREMRMDLISYDLYNTDEYTDFLCDINNIDLPLNVMYNDILYYVSADKIPYFRIDESGSKNIRSVFINNAKVSSIDNNRNKYIQNNYSLPPTFLDTPADSVKIVSGNIILGGNV